MLRLGSHGGVSRASPDLDGGKDECACFFFPKESSHLDKVIYWSNDFMRAMLAILSGEKFPGILFFEQTE